MHTPLLFALNHLLRQSTWARDRLLRFAGRKVCLSMGALQLPLVIDGAGLLGAASDPANPDVSIELPADTPFRLLHGGAAEAMKVARISGAADLADAFGIVLRNLRWDAEEDLARLVGDLAAHRLTVGLRSFAQWQQDGARRLAENLAEYFVHEKPTVLGAAAFKVFSADLARLQARLEAAEQRSLRLR